MTVDVLPSCGVCRSCKARIVWGKFPTGGLVPVDADREFMPTEDPTGDLAAMTTMRVATEDGNAVPMPVSRVAELHVEQGSLFTVDMSRRFRSHRCETDS